MTKAMLDLVAKREEAINKGKALKEGQTDELKAVNKEIAEIDDQIATLKDFEDKQRNSVPTDPKPEPKAEDADIRTFANYIRGVKDTETTLTKSDNGVVLPTTIANKIIEKVQQISPVYGLCDKYTVKGTLNIPKESESADAVTVDFVTEGTDVTSHSSALGTVSLTGYLYGALVKISKSLLNNSDFDLVNWVINRMARKIAVFLERCIIVGNGSVLGVAGSYDATNHTVTFASATAVTADELIDIQESVPDDYQDGAVWVMNKATRKAIRKLKDGQGNYLLERDYEAGNGRFSLLGHPVYASDNVPVMAASAKAIYYGNFSGVAVKEIGALETQVLYEKFSTAHQIGVEAFNEIDCKVENVDCISVGVCHTA